MSIIRIPFILALLLGCQVVHAKDYALRYTFTFVPEQQAVEVRISMPASRWLKRAEFDLSGYSWRDLDYSGSLKQTQGKAIWLPPAKNAFLTYRVFPNHQRESGEYDAYINKDWALLRGEDLVPPVKTRHIKGADVDVMMTFDLPKDWSSVNTGWKKMDERSFAIINRKYSFARPSGWIIAGKVGTRREQVGDTEISVSAPKGQDFKQMEKLVFITMIWPHLAQAIDIDEPQLMIAGAASPMWRGGLSGPNSLYMHRDRPMVSENGTSTIIHELFHVISRIDSDQQSDWIIEGLAEFYAIEILYRARGITDARRNLMYQKLNNWSKSITNLSAASSKGPRTAKAVLVFDALNRELLDQSNKRYSLDDLVQRIQGQKNLGPADLQKAYKALTGKASNVLRSSLWGGQ